MGTRNLIVIYYNGKYVLANYGQWDGYPEGQGFRILKFLSTPGQTTALKSNLHLLRVATSDELKAISEECEQADREEKRRRSVLLLAMDESAVSRRYPSLSRDTGAKILNLIADAKDDKPILIYDVKESLEFSTDIFCEWIYEIDLDANKLKVFSGTVTMFDAGAEGSRLVPSLQTGELTDTIPQFLVEFDIEKLPTEKEFVSQIQKRGRELESREDHGNRQRSNDEKGDTN